MRLALVNDYDVIVHGLAHMLAPYRDRIRVVEFDLNREPSRRLDLALYDTFSDGPMRFLGLPDALADGRLVIYSWDFERQAVDAAMAAGAVGYLSKSMSAGALVDALERIRGGHPVVSQAPGPDDASPEPRSWPGRAAGLSERESEVVALIAQGLTNQEIAQRLHLSINTIKAYIKSAYRAIRVTNRSRAVLWAVDHGMRAVTKRDLDPSGEQDVE